MTSPIVQSNWTPKEEAYLRRVWGGRTKQKIAETLGRTVKSVECKARSLGLGKPATKAAIKPPQKVAPAKTDDGNRNESEQEQSPIPYPQEKVNEILYHATASRIPTIEEAEEDLREAIEKCCHATCNHPLTKQRCQMLLMAWNVLDMIEKF